MTTPPPVRQSYVPALASMRGFAAVGILLYHASVDFGVDDDIWRYNYLKIAVTFFFILSGFVLTRGWRDEAKTLQWQRRAARILPMYMLAWLLTLAGRSYVHWIPGQGELLATLLMVQAWWPSPRLSMAVNPVGWSLSCEVLCYLLLPFVIPTLRRANDVVLRRVTTVVIGWAVVGTALTGVFPIEWWVGYRASEFFIGVMAAEWLRRGWRPGANARTIAALATAVLVVLAGLTPDLPVPVADLLAAPLFVWLVLGAAIRHENPLRAKPRGSPLGQALGRWSYSLYVTHWVVLVLLSRFLVGAVWIVPSMIVCLLGAAVLYTIVERPAEHYLRQLGRRVERSSPTPTPDPDLVI